MFKYLAACLAIFMGASAAHAEIQIVVNDYPLLPNKADQKIVIYVIGDEYVNAVQVQCQIGDGYGNAISGPTIQALDIITGTSFEGHNTGLSYAPPGDGHAPGYVVDQLFSLGTTTPSSTPPAPPNTVLANGILATVTISTLGQTTLNQTWDLCLKNTRNQSTVYGQKVPVITNGHVYIASSVPEPASALLVAAGATLLLRRRRRAA
jgi:hypothetical protein